MATAGELRNALQSLRNASGAEKNRAKSVALTLGAQTALEISDRGARAQFVESYESDIDDAMSA
jgi:hypothetical protein